MKWIKTWWGTGVRPAASGHADLGVHLDALNRGDCVTPTLDGTPRQGLEMRDACVGTSDDVTEPEWVYFSEMKYWIPNVIDWVRFALCITATFAICWDWNIYLTAGMLYLQYWLDLWDGKMARKYKQCSELGNGLDWSCDCFGEFLNVYWWSRVEPAVAPFVIVFIMLQVATAIFDYAAYVSKKAAPMGKQTGFTLILEWMTPGGRWTDFGWYMWFFYPFFVLARCLSLSGSASPLYILEMTQVFCAVPAFCTMWWNVAMLPGTLSTWREPKKVYAH